MIGTVQLSRFGGESASTIVATRLNSMIGSMSATISKAATSNEKMKMAAYKAIGKDICKWTDMSGV